MVFDKNIICQNSDDLQPAVDYIRGELQKIEVITSEFTSAEGFMGSVDSFDDAADYYYIDPREKVSLRASGRLISLINFSFDEIAGITKDVSFNKGSQSHPDIPILLSVIGFDDGGQDPMWEGIPLTEWFIPASVEFTRDGTVYHSTISYAGEKEISEDAAETETNSALFTVLSDKPDDAADEILWNENIEYIRNAIENGVVKKVVLARRVSGVLPKEYKPSEIFKDMVRENPLDTGYYFKRGDAVFMGVTPEKLLQIQDESVKTEAIAGSIKRNGIYNEQQMEEVLTSSEKDLDEHIQVREFLVDNLTPFTTGIRFDPKPTVRKLRNLFHLMTGITGKLKNPRLDTTIRLAAGLFPTPAVCGTPKEKAFELIGKLEEHPRGLYSGVIGFLSLNGDCQLAVSIRSVLLRGSVYSAYAGCGIVKNSDPKLEFEESRVKLKTATAPFEYANQP